LVYHRLKHLHLKLLTPYNQVGPTADVANKIRNTQWTLNSIHVGLFTTYSAYRKIISKMKQSAESQQSRWWLFSRD